MKINSFSGRNASAPLRLAVSLTALALVPLLLFGSAPSWWSQRGVLTENALPDDYAPVNQGQLKNIAKAAVAEMDAKLSGGAGDQLHDLITAWESPNPETNDFAPVNLGQLKNVAKPFYDRLIAAGLVDYYPWLSSLSFPDDFAIANIGQVKKLFGFDIPAANLLDDPLGDRIAAGEMANLALEGNVVWIWADHFSSGSDFERNFPHRISGLSSIRSVSAGERHLVALRSDGTVWTWGENGSGQLGDNTNTTRLTPAAIPNLANVVSVKAGGLHTLALKDDGTVVAWGDNYYGQLASGDTNPASVPTAVIGLTNVRKIAAGYQRSVALKNDGTVWTWGYDHYSGHDIFSPFPSAVPNLTDVIDVAAGYEHTVAVRADGTVWAWGSNYANQIANGNPWWMFQDIPFLVPNLSNITKVASSYDHTLALAADGTVWAWGINSGGQLGDGTTAPRQTPVQVSGLTNVVAIATAYSCSLAMKADGTVWAWGNGATGTLPSLDLRVPQLVGLGLLDTNHNGMDDRWEMQFLGNLDQSGDADSDGDGISNRQEFLRGTNPTDYYNGIAPLIEIAGGNNQIGDPGTLLNKPFKVLVRNAAGQVLVNAPVRFTVSAGSVAITLNGPQESSVLVRTDRNGEAATYHVLPDVPGYSSRTVAAADSSAISASVTFRGVARLSPPPTPAPSATPPDPNATPTPTPSPTIMPVAPYRYAIIDLGKDLYPLRVNNKGWVLLAGFDANGNWAYFRWKGGTMERLTYSGAQYEWLVAKDINDEGIVVGSYRRIAPWVSNAENEITSGLTWMPNMSEAVKTLAPVAAPTWTFRLTGSEKWVLFNTITNSNVIYADVRTSGGYDSFLNTFDIFNAYRMPESQLSFGMATKVFDANQNRNFFSVSGETDQVTRANADGHYIGSKFSLRSVKNGHPPSLEGTPSGMIDGYAVNFSPIDINEAGMVVGSAGADMVVYSSSTSRTTISGASPLAINDHTRPASPSGQASPAPGPSPTPIPAPQILGWTNSVQALWERQPDGQAWHPFGLEEMIPSMDGWDSLEPYDMNDTGTIVGRAWYTDPSSPSAQGESHAFMLVPAELVPDFDRDGIIADNDRGKVTESDPWRWWINDDDDELETGGKDIPDAINPNFETAPILSGAQVGTIDGIRDLVDFFPLYLDIRPLLKLFPVEGSSPYVFKLKQEDGALNFVYTDLRRDTASNYLWTLNGDARDNATTLGGTTRGNGAVTNRITKEGVVLDPAWLKLITTDGRGIILLEGRGKSDRPIILEVSSHDGRKLAACRFPVSVSPVEEMYRHKNLMAAGGGSGGPSDRLGEPPNYPDSLANNKSFVIVHGYNVNPEAARGWGAEMFKRLHCTGSKAKFYYVTWYGAETQIGGSVTTDYQANIDNAFATAEEFAAFIGALSDVTVAAHSLGNMLVGSAIQDWGARPSNYFMIDAAVAKESYDDTEEELSNGAVIGMDHPEWQSYSRRLWASDWHLLFAVGDNRTTLTWKNRLKKVADVTTYNFYSTGEEVLKNPSSAPHFPLSSNEVWNNQERMKGRMLTGQVLSSNYGGWAFNNYWDVPHTEVNTITDAQLRVTPFFSPGPSELYGAHGSNYASPQQHRNTLLAEMVPALSFAAGSNALESRGDGGNFDMMMLKNEWPQERLSQNNPNWLHSDFKTVAYLYMHPVLLKMMELGELNQ